MQNKKGLWAGLAIVLIAALMAGAYFLFMPKGTVGAKNVTVVIEYGDMHKTIGIRTDAAYLRGALEQEKLIQGEESEYGLYVKTVDGYTADEAKQEWWCFTKGGGMLTTGVEATPIADGDKFEVTLKTGY